MPRCRWIEDPTMPEGKWFMPECMGGVHNGKEGCICPTYEEQDKLIEELKNENRTLRQRLERLAKKRAVS